MSDVGAKLRSKWGRLRDMTSDQFWLLVQSTWMLACVRHRIRREGYKRVSQWARRMSVRMPVRSDPVRATRLGWAVNAAARRVPYEANCLVRSLWLLRVLHNKGLEGALCIGVKIHEGSFSAHAWIEAAGQPINDLPDIAQMYQPIAVDDLPVSGAWT